MKQEFVQLLQQLESGKYAPTYLLEGEEPYYIDKLIGFFEEKIIAPEERDFNLIILYGREVEWKDVVNAARRFPMFAERTVVILKEAAQMKGLGDLLPYIERPSESTLLVIEHRFKKVDGKTKLAKALAKHAVCFTSEKLKESEVPAWARHYGKEIGLAIGEKESEMLATYLGNDLQKIANELDKVLINEPGLRELTRDHIEKHIGISKEYNVFDLPDVLFNGDLHKLARMMGYFAANPKSAPMAVVIGTFYGYLNKVYVSQNSAADFAQDRKSGIWPQHRKMAQRYKPVQIHKCIFLLEEFSCKMVGIDSLAGDVSLLKEMVGKIRGALTEGAA